MIYDESAMNNGVIFQRAYDILNEKMNQGIAKINNKSNDGMARLDASLIVWVAVNCSFACERKPFCLCLAISRILWCITNITTL